MRTGEVKFTTTRRTERIEGDLENVRRSVAALTEMVVELRARVFPVPMDMISRTDIERSQSGDGAVRTVHEI